MANKDRFDLEHDIMEVWAIKEHLQILLWRMFDHPEIMDEDQQMNHLFAVQNSLDLRCEKLMDTFCQTFELNEYAPQEVKDYRAEVLRNLEAKADKTDFPVKPQNVKKQGKKK